MPFLHYDILRFGSLKLNCITVLTYPPLDIILLTKITAEQNEISLSYRRVRGLYFLTVILRLLYTDISALI